MNRFILRRALAALSGSRKYDAAIFTILILSILAIGCTGPQLELLSQHGNPTSVKVNGEDDYSYIYTVRIRNKGSAGRVRTIAELHTPEGQFQREQIVEIDHDEAMTLKFTFDEVTVFGEVLSGLAGKSDLKYRFRYESL